MPSERTGVIMMKNIILDMGNVLLSFDPEKSLQAFLENDEDRAIIRKELFQGPEWEQGDYGIITNEERYTLVSKRVPERLHPALKECVDKWSDFMQPIPGAMDFCEYVKNKGYGIYVLSNACSLFGHYFPRFAPVSYFDGVMVSSDVHLVKPEKEIYELFLQTYNLNPTECLFIDDRPENIEGAQAVHISGYIFTGDFQDIIDKYKL